MNHINHQLEAEVLGFIIYAPAVENKNKFAIFESVELKDFYTPAHRDIYEACIQTFVKTGGVDYVSLGIHPKAKKHLDHLFAIPHKDYWNDTKFKVAELKGRSKLERLKNLVMSMQGKIQSDEPVNDILKTVEDFIFNEYKAESTTIDLSGAVDELLHKLESDDNIGFDWLKEVPSFREITGGIELGKLYVIGATKKSGKTRLAVAIMKRLIEQSQKPTFISMEMREPEVTKLFLSSFSGVSSHRFNRRLHPMDLQQILEKKNLFIENLHLDCESHISLEKMRSKIYRASQRGSSVVFIDFLQRMNFQESRNKNWATIVGDTVARIADIARDYKVAIVLLSQLRNEAETSDIVDMRYLKDSGGIAENADTIITINNRQRQETGKEKLNNAESGFVAGEEVDFWLNIEQRSGENRLIKTIATLGRLQFREKTDRKEPESWA